MLRDTANCQREGLGPVSTNHRIDCEAHLFHKTILLEFVAVREAAQQSPLPLFIDVSDFILRPAKGSILLDIRRVVRICARVSMTSLVRFAVEQKVAKDTTGTPEETVRPALDATLVLIKHKHRA